MTIPVATPQKFNQAAQMRDFSQADRQTEPARLPARTGQESLIARLKEVLPHPNTAVQGMRAKGGGEVGGPCPLCGGTDRFFIRSDGSFCCRQCNPKGGDTIDFYQWLHDEDLRGLAVRYLNPNAPPVSLPAHETDEQQRAGLKQRPVKQRVTGRYEYRGADGGLLYWKERIEPGREGRAKEFRFCHGDRQSGRGGNPVPYRLNEIATAKAVIFTEGEKQADLLNFWGLATTTLDSGAKSPWRDEYLPYFVGKRIALLPDNDTAGRGYADCIATALHGHVESLKVVDLPGLPEKGDICEWTQDPDNDKARLLELIKAAPEWESVRYPLTEENPAAGESESLEWPEPVHLPDGLPPVKTLEPEMIPAPLRGWLMDISDRMQIPPDFSAAAAVVALGSVIGRACGIYPKRRDDWLVVPNLWGAVVGRPSLMKTPAVSEGQKPLVRLESEAREEYEETVKVFELDAEIMKITRAAYAEELKRALKKGDVDEVGAAKNKLAAIESDVPHRARYQTQDGTTEKIGELLIENPRGLLVNRDELIGWFRALDKDGREGDRAFYLEAWNGNRAFTYDRIGRGTLDIPALSVSVFGAMTPGSISTYVYQANRGGIGDDGLLQRFQVSVWPDAPTEWKNIDRFPDTTEKNRAWQIFKALSGDIPGAVIESGSSIPALRFSSGGQEIFDTWRNELETRLRGDHGLHPSLESHLTKYRKLMPSLALIFHLATVADGAALGPVSEVSAVLAAAWCQYLESHAMRVYGAASMPGMESAREIVKHIRRGAIVTGVTVREIWRHQWTRLTTPEDVRAGLEVLEQYDWLNLEKTVPRGKGGRPSEIVQLNPRIKL